MHKQIRLIVDKKSWESGPPAELDPIKGLKYLDVSKALLHVALRTRPPSSVGIHLSDFWSWLRYFPAISHCPHLALRHEWEDIDPHQKTVLSDDWGVGFSTGIIGQVFNVVAWADTHFLIKLLGTKFGELQSDNKLGPKKSPDFIGGRLTPSPSIIVLECKGTQTSRAHLNKQLKAGKAQKSSLKVSAGIAVAGSMVGGIFVTNEINGEYAVFKVADPGIKRTDKKSASVDDFFSGLLQAEYAALLPLAGFSELGQLFTASPWDSPAAIPRQDRRFSNIERFHADDEVWHGVKLRFPLVGVLHPDRERHLTEVRVSFGLSDEVLRSIKSTGNVRDANLRVLVDHVQEGRFDEKHRVSRNIFGPVEDEGAGPTAIATGVDMMRPVSIVTPLGMRLEVEWIWT